MQSRSRRRTHVAITAAALLAVGVLPGCADSESSSRAADRPSGASVDEIAAHDGQVCPKRLPQGKDGDYGFGTAEPAESAPLLPAPEEAWVCQYNPTEAGPGPDGDGTTVGWVRTGEVRSVHSTELPALERGLTELAPVEGDLARDDDLGPRWMLVYSHGSDLTGVVVDGFGCRVVRLTDEPFETVPGDAAQAGTVPGVLAGPAGLLDDLKAVSGS